MKKLFLLPIASLVMLLGVSCSTGQVQVEYADGEVKWVDNPKDVTVGIGDSVVIRHYSSFSSFRSSDELYGYYKGVMPMGTLDSLFTISYRQAVVIKD